MKYTSWITIQTYEIIEPSFKNGRVRMIGYDALFTDLNAIKSEKDLKKFLILLTKKFDFSGFLMADIPVVRDNSLAQNILMSDLPKGFLEEYDEGNFLENSPVFNGLRQSTIPIRWQAEAIENIRLSSGQKSIIKIFQKYRLTSSIFYPVHGSNGSRAVIALVGNRAALEYEKIGELSIFVIHAYDIYCKLNSTNPQGTNILTARELEVLSWAANGKTSTEIASILSISDHTVNAYMNNAMRKLDCVNRTHLVAKALRLHLIR